MKNSILLTVALLLPAALLLAQPASPMLNLPADSSFNQPHSRSFVWNASANAESYQLQISRNVNFSSTVFNRSGLTDTTAFVEIQNFGTRHYWRVRASNTAGNSAYSPTYSFTTWNSIPKGPMPVELGMAQDFAILSHTAITNVPSSAILGNVGVSPASGAFIGLTQGEVTGTIFAVDASGPAGSVASPSMLTTAKGDITIAFNDAAGRTVDPIGIAGNIGGQTLYPGLYKSTGTLEITAGDLTLDGGGHNDAVWIFQIATSFNMTSGRQVFLTNGANAANIYWQVGTLASFGTTTVMHGTILAGTQVTMATLGTLNGRALALTANVTLQQNVINNPGPAVGTSIETNDNQNVKTITLSQNYPNPFNPSTVIGFTVGTQDHASLHVRLAVYDLLGREVAVLVNGPMSAGAHTVAFDASTLSSGMYIYRIVSNGEQVSRRMMLVK